MTWQFAAHLTDLPPGEVRRVMIGDEPVALYNVEGEIFATHDICTHAHASLADGYFEDGMIECPLHQAVFDIRTGRVVSGPTSRNLPTYAVRIEDARVLVQLSGPGAPGRA